MTKTVNVKVSATTLTAVIAIAAALTAGGLPKAGEVTAVPGPSDQGGMIMPMISITGDPQNPT
jgi:hypothetical protein